MSLLLEALKKAEKAKEEAQKRARGVGSEPARGELQLEPAGEPAKVLTRPELPDIRQPLEIASDDLAEKSTRAPIAPAPAQTRAAAAAPQSGAAERATAKKVFEAKFKERNPRLPFYVTLGALGAFGVGMVLYFWWQLRPPAPLVNLNPKPTAQAVATAPGQGAPVQTPSAAAAPQIPGLPPAPAKAAVAREADARAAARTVPPAAPTAAAAPSASAAVAAAAARRSAEPEPRGGIRFTQPKSQIHPRVESGYAAYTSGDLSRAREHYEQAVREEPSNRDALLGLAAVEARGGRHAAAEALYVRLLQMDPRDAHAQAGLIGLRGGRTDPVAAESRVKSLLASEPGAAVLHFTLGNQLAQQERWPEAQQEYFKAFAAEPGNPDFAYNLAVSLDQLRQPRAALEYYRRALELAGKASAGFDADAVRERVSKLSP